MDGVINILKPPGMTSHDVVSFLRRELNTKKIGHTGTLDPQAAGVLPLCIGRATRLVDYIAGNDKEYLCEMTLGITTTTQDAWGDIVSIKNASHICLDEIAKGLSRFNGEITQITPGYSAVKVDGIPLYKRARQGLEVKEIPRQVSIYNIKVIKYEPPRLTFIVSCSKGTYVRTICNDLGEILGVGAHMSFLVRTRVGSFMLDESITLEEVAVSKERALLPIEYCVKGLEQIILPQNEIEKLKHGQIVPLHKSAEGTENIAVLNYNRKLQAIAVIYNSNNESFLKPKKVFNME